MKKFIIAFMAISIIAFIMLGIWQLNRLVWKTSLIEKAQKNSSQPPLDGLVGDINDDMLFTHVKFEGKIISDKRIFVVQSHNQQYVYRLFAPVLVDDKTVIVDFGLTKDKNIVLPKSFSSMGILFNFDRKNIFYPANNPQKDVWYNLDHDSMEQYFGLVTEPYLIKITPGHAVNEQMIIKPFATSYRNDHLMYAITWFMLAGFCSIIFYLRIRR